MLEVKSAELSGLKEMEAFFGDHYAQLQEPEQLVKYGHYVEIHKKKKGFFALVPVDNNQYWLRTLYIQPDMNPQFIMTLFEVMGAHMQEQHMQKVYVHSHHASLDALLTAQQYKAIADEDVPDSLQTAVEKKGTWWVQTAKS